MKFGKQIRNTWQFTERTGKEYGWKAGQIRLTQIGNDDDPRYNWFVGWFPNQKDCDAAKKFLIANFTPKQFFTAKHADAKGAPARVLAAKGFKSTIQDA